METPESSSLDADARAPALQRDSGRRRLCRWRRRPGMEASLLLCRPRLFNLHTGLGRHIGGCGKISSAMAMGHMPDHAAVRRACLIVVLRAIPGCDLYKVYNFRYRFGKQWRASDVASEHRQHDYQTGYPASHPSAYIGQILALQQFFWQHVANEQICYPYVMISPVEVPCCAVLICSST